MFVQLIRGQVDDREALRRQVDRWTAELAPGATGWTGTVAGIAADGRSSTMVCFESEAAARSNSDRPEQGEWWAETEKCFTDEPTFAESSDVVQLLGGVDASAGFVQFMFGGGVDRGRVEALDATFDARAAEIRPDVLGGLRVWTSPDSYAEAICFTSEADARAGESAPMPDDLAAEMASMADVLEGVEFLDGQVSWVDLPGG